MPLFVVAYDIADPRRLRRVARIMERYALRTQRSVFLFQGTEKELEQLLNRVTKVMVLAEDLVQAWQLRGDERWMGRYRGTPLWLCPQSAIAIAENGSICIVPRPSDLEYVGAGSRSGSHVVRIMPPPAQSGSASSLAQGSTPSKSAAHRPRTTPRG